MKLVCMVDADQEPQRQDMLEKPNVDLVDDLHWLGRRLSILKHLYQSYELVIMRLLQRQRLLRDEARTQRNNYRNLSTYNDAADREQMHMSLSMASVNDAYDDTAGVRLTSAAVGRFERLADRIRLYCLSEIETCLAEKETLTFMVRKSSLFVVISTPWAATRSIQQEVTDIGRISI